MRPFIVAVTILALAPCGVLHAGPVKLDTISANFQLADPGGGAQGGGASALIDNGVNIFNVEIFDVDFANAIDVPHAGYSVNLTALTSGGFTAATTRLGGNASWRTVTIADDGTDGGADDAADSAIINAANALGRYQMAAYLISQYNVAAGNTLVNRGLQSAIWALLDPTSDGAAFIIADPSGALEQAAVWYNSTTVAARDSYLKDYKLVSDSTMTACGPVLCGGIQEQITAVNAVPEPGTLLLLGAGAVACFRRRRTK
jgi:hypothetical protein